MYANNKPELFDLKVAGLWKGSRVIRLHYIKVIFDVCAIFCIRCDFIWFSSVYTL